MAISETMDLHPGDFILFQGTGFFDKLIQFGQSLRFPKEDSKWNHAALVISREGDLVESLAKGVKQTNVSKYFNSVSCQVYYTGLSLEDQKECIGFALSCVKDGYGWTTIVSSAICLLFGLKFSFGFSGENICSGLVARSLEHGGVRLFKDASHTTPADLAKLYAPKIAS